MTTVCRGPPAWLSKSVQLTGRTVTHSHNTPGVRDSGHDQNTRGKSDCRRFYLDIPPPPHHHHHHRSPEYFPAHKWVSAPIPVCLLLALVAKIGSLICPRLNPDGAHHHHVQRASGMAIIKRATDRPANCDTLT